MQRSKWGFSTGVAGGDAEIAQLGQAAALPAAPLAGDSIILTAAGGSRLAAFVGGVWRVDGARVFPVGTAVLGGAAAVAGGQAVVANAAQGSSWLGVVIWRGLTNGAEVAVVAISGPYATALPDGPAWVDADGVLNGGAPQQRDGAFLIAGQITAGVLNLDPQTL